MGTKFDGNQQKVNILMLNRTKIQDEDSNEILIKDLWRENPVALVFIRHFSCIGCRAHVDQIWKKKEQLRKNKINIAFIGNGAPYLIKAFKEDLKIWDAPIYTDPSLKSFDACGLVRSVLSLMDPRGVKKMVQLGLQGHRQGPWDSDSGAHTQMGGVVMMKPPGKVIYHFISDYLGDTDNPDDWKVEDE